MSLQQCGLILFSMVVGLNAAGLGLDAALYAENLPTVSDFARKNQWAASLIVALNIVGLVGLMVHFSVFNGGQK